MNHKRHRDKEENKATEWEKDDNDIKAQECDANEDEDWTNAWLIKKGKSEKATQSYITADCFSLFAMTGKQ